MTDLNSSHVKAIGPKIRKIVAAIEVKKKKTTKSYFNNITKKLNWNQKTCRVRLKELHIFNEPKIFESLYAIVKIFLPEKTKKRVN